MFSLTLAERHRLSPAQYIALYVYVLRRAHLSNAMVGRSLLCNKVNCNLGCDFSLLPAMIGFSCTMSVCPLFYLINFQVEMGIHLSKINLYNGENGCITFFLLVLIATTLGEKTNTHLICMKGMHHQSVLPCEILGTFVSNL